MSTPDDRLAVDHMEPDEREPEASPEDVAEQAVLADPFQDEDDAVHVNGEANEWDAIEQARIVDLEDDQQDL